jgi:hypothetical protein
MASITGLQSGNFTDIDVIYTISINGDAGQDGQILSSDGTNTLWIDGSTIDREDLTAADTTITISGGAYDGQVARTIQTNKVPNVLTFTGTATGTFDGSGALTINLTDTDTQLNLTEGNGITITDTGGVNRTIAAKPDEDTIDFDGTDLQVQKVPNAITINTVSFDGSVARNFTLATSDTTYQGGLNIGIDTTTTPDTINLDKDLTTIRNITYDGVASTTLTGSNFSNDPTTATYLDLTSGTNVIKPYFAHAIEDPVSYSYTILSTSYVEIFSGNLKTTFVAQTTTVLVSLMIYNYTLTSNKSVYFGLADDAGMEWSVGLYSGGNGTGTRVTERIYHYADETDKQVINAEWYLQGLTIGTTYIVNPTAKTSGTINYVFAGGAYPPCILKFSNI